MALILSTSCQQGMCLSGLHACCLGCDTPLGDHTCSCEKTLLAIFRSKWESLANSLMRHRHRHGQTNRDKFQIFDYPICLDLTIHTPSGDLPAIMCNGGVCYKSRNDPNRLNVTFNSYLPAR